MVRFPAFGQQRMAYSENHLKIDYVSQCYALFSNLKSMDAAI